MNLVFASGFLMPQHLLGIDYFRGLDEHLRRQGFKAIFPAVPPTGTSETRAEVLADLIQQAFPEGPIHIIAHSMGGLDSRYLIARNLRGLSAPGRIASLTTLSTPHRGSPIADLLAGSNPEGAQRMVYEGIRHMLSQLTDINTGALANLTTEAASRVPDTTKSHAHIRYHSYFASGRPGLLATSLVLAPAYHYIRAVSGLQNDGVVTIESAQYGEFQTPYWPCDHIDMIGHNLDTADLGHFQFDHLKAFDAIIASLP